MKENEDYRNEGEDDPYFELFFPIVHMKKNETRELNLNLGNYWLYDPNCEIKIELDYNNRIKETSEENNIEYFIAGG